MKQPVIEHTADGSPTLYLSDLNEHYHSVKGALTESMHVYVDTGWRAAAALNNRLKVFEVGFGTGLNAALTADAALAGKVYTEYHSVELHPLPADLTAMMGYDKLAPFYDAVNRAPWNTRVRINDFFFLTKSAGNFLTMELPENIAVVYFDAFAPEKQPEMWSPDVFNRLYEAMIPDAILSTYCAKGEVRRRIQSAGFMVERLPGPPGGKREILRATRSRLQEPAREQ